MIYISPRNEYPRHYGDIQLENPGWNYGDQLPEGWTLVNLSEAPVVGENQVAYEVAPVERNGSYFQAFEVRDLTAEELAARELNRVRNKVANGESLTEAEAALLVG